MGLDDRLIYFLLGCALGMILGYIVAALRYLKEELDEVDEIVKKDQPQRSPKDDERGEIHKPTMMGAALFLVVLLTAWAAFASQQASNDAHQALQRQDLISSCNQKFLSKMIVALNERTEFTQEQNSSNIDLQKAQAKFFGLLLHDPPFSQEIQAHAAQAYFEALTDYITVSEKAQQKVAENPFPTDTELSDCLSGK